MKKAATKLSKRDDEYNDVSDDDEKRRRVRDIILNSLLDKHVFMFVMSYTLKHFAG